MAALKSLLLQPVRAWPGPARAWVVVLLFVYTIAGVAIMDHWQHRGGLPLRDLGFGYGVLIDAINQTGEYRVAAGVHAPVAFSAHRLPFIPYFLIALQRVLGDDQGRVLAAKCLLFNLLIILAVWRVLRTSAVPGWGVAALLGLALTMPRWVLNVFEAGLEEGYNIPALTLLFVLLWFDGSVERARARWAVELGLLLGLLVFLKSSMLYWCLAVPLLAAWRLHRPRAAVGPLAFVLAALLALAAFNRVHAGRFTIESSWEGWNLTKGNCAETATLYPAHTLDLLDYEGGITFDRPLRDEWDYNTVLKQRAVAFIRAHPGEFLHLAALKAWVFYFEVRATGLARGETPTSKPAYVLQIPWMIAYRVLQWTAIVLAIRAVGRERWGGDASVVAISFLAFLVLYSGFHLVGFAYERHVMPVVMPVMLYLLWHWGARREAAAAPATS